MSELHVDYVVNDWEAEVQRCRCRMWAEDGRLSALWVGEVTSPDSADLFVEMTEDRLGRVIRPEDLARLSGGNGYAWFTEPHTDDGCPFAEGDTLAMERVEPREDLRLLTPAEAEQAITDGLVDGPYG